MKTSVLGLLLASLAFQGGVQGQAETAVQSRLNKEPRSTLLRLEVVDSLVYEGRWQSALGILEETLKETTPNAVLLCKLGNLHLRLGRYEDARATFIEALKLDPLGTDPRYGLVKVYEALLDWERARTLAREICAKDPGNYFGNLHLAWSSFNLRDYDAALQIYASGIHEHDRDMMLGKGWCLFRLGKAQEAQTIFTQLVQRFPDDFEAKNALYEIRKTGPASVAVAATQASETAREYLELARSARQAGKLLESLNYALLAKEAKPEDVPPLETIAADYLDLGNWTQADFYYSVLLNRQEKPEYLYGKIIALRSLGKLSEAADYGSKLLAVDAKNITASLALGDVSYQCGDFQKALDYYAKPEASATSLLLGQGWSLLQLNRSGEARKRFQEVSVLDPGNCSAHEGLNAIKRKEPER